jgi:hypothetical protein
MQHTHPHRRLYWAVGECRYTSAYQGRLRRPSILVPITEGGNTLRDSLSFLTSYNICACIGSLHTTTPSLVLSSVLSAVVLLFVKRTLFLWLGWNWNAGNCKRYFISHIIQITDAWHSLTFHFTVLQGPNVFVCHMSSLQTKGNKEETLTHFWQNQRSVDSVDI